MRRWVVASVPVALLVAVSGVARAQAVKPRFVLMLDTSSSMVENPSGTRTYGDGSLNHEGCDLDNSAAAGKYAYDDSRLYQAKGAIADTIAAFGSAEFALARFKGVNLGQACTTDDDCPINPATNAVYSGVNCVGGVCLYNAAHYACTTCPVRCKTPFDSRITFRSTACRGGGCGSPCQYPTCKAGEVLVPFPGSGASNYTEMAKWMNGTDATGFASSSSSADPELHADLGTPLASSLDSMREWLTTELSVTGPNSGPLLAGHMFSDSRPSCRAYNVILLTDGVESCCGDAPGAATALHHTCTNGGSWDAADGRCEKNGSPVGTIAVNVYVIGFGVQASEQTALNAIAAGGGTGTAFFPTDRAQLTAKLAEIVASSLPRSVCDCDGSCDDEAAAFPDKGSSCTVGLGRCKRTGVYACNAGGDGTICSSTPASTCPGTPLQPGAPVMEQCGAAPGCNAPTPEDCADDDCDGQVDEGLSCACTPEVCNGKDDDCNDVVDDVPAGTCGLNIGICKPGTSRCVSDGMGGASTVCEGSTGPRAEDCNGLDDNCNGIVDDVVSRVCYPMGFLGCTYNAGRGRYDCKGQCQAGLQACVMGSWDQSACSGAITPLAEVPCDKRDNNCDGLVDENDPGPNDACYPAGVTGCTQSSGVWTCVGECKTGRLACDANTGAPSCHDPVTPSAEVCDGKDNDCDGMTDEGFDVGAACDNGVSGPCRKTGKKVCNSVGTGTVCNAGASTPGDEVCDGQDNDCDGQIDEDPLPGVGVMCGSPVGECHQGITRCQNGMLVCTAVGPQPEVCDGLDNNCNGSVDENLPGTGEECRPAGVPAGPLMGECRPGKRICVGMKGWECQGGVGPQPEICDGKDNDCDGIVDGGAPCAAGASCMNGECLPACKAEETQRCPSDRLCRDGYCVRKACADHPCADGERCNAEGVCAAPCAAVVCPSGTTCEGGLCHDCHTRNNCKEGEICRVHDCEPDPCYRVSCVAGSYCRDGACVKTCPASCGSGQHCQDGACVVDRCANVTCNGTDYCDPVDGACKASGCVGVSCMIGMVCLKQTGACEVDPCQVTHCAYGDVCRVSPGGGAQCVFDPSIPGSVKSFAASGGGCSCRLAGRGQGSSALIWVLVGLVAGGYRRARRRRRGDAR